MKKPTDGELEILSILWDKGPSSVRDVHETLEETKGSKYTTTLKLLQIMHEKGLVKRDTAAKVHIYEAIITKDSTQKQLINKIIDTVFDGSASQLVMQALGHHKTNAKELEAIKKYLDNLDK
ncbi:MAG: BlaI/MecI/CopY family transcriptional regulator [Chitinophagales bacterium]|nr:BlaI/MecI/CopY family transcriptional regulator [Chitinophagaceae bacterium]MCB9065637.1 BlaI/MecI/CopY family transcriptional regulator [Chitinophagales bacterium]